ncbi:Uncharacterised protein [Klebsiella pneumoniae]|nr:Uncharacterised protein [Klebsiella pneumoniae]
MLVVGTIAGRKTDLRKRIVKTGTFSNLRQLTVVVDIPTGTLRDITDH